VRNILKFISVFLLFFIFFSYGYFVCRDKIFPYSILKDFFGSKTGRYVLIEKAQKKSWYKKMNKEIDNKVIIINEYNNGYYIFNDRLYTNNSNNSKLVGKTLVQISRHRSSDLKIILKESVFIYRVLCDSNNNEHYIDWLDVDYSVKINGLSCVHKKVIKKYFSNGVSILRAGGPIAADPIFIDKADPGNILIYSEK
jgi:transcriptional regulator with PAS, ATPase and Fis domain